MYSIVLLILEFVMIEVMTEMQQGEQIENENLGIDLEPEPQRNNRSPFQLSVSRFMKNKLAVTGLVILLFIILVAVFAPFLTSHSPTEANMLKIENHPSSEHILGTDASGRDNFARLIYGARVSLVIGLS